MKNIFLSFLFLLFTTALFAQQKTDTVLHKKKYFIGGNIAYGLGGEKIYHSLPMKW
jgi:hypothetical protein